MKDIKFRSYTPSGMIQIISINFQNNKAIFNDVLGVQEIDIDEFPLMQYTGLKDDKGIEIYEGDIVKVYGGECYAGIYEFNEKYIVKWQGNGFDLINIKDNEGIGWGLCDIGENIIVIGNIYETPLLI